MFSPWIRLLLTVVAFGLALARIDEGGVEFWLPAAAGLLLVYGYFRYGTISWAFQAFRHGDMERVRRRLAHTPSPRLLSAPNRAFLAWMRGSISLQDDDLESARAYLTTAFEGRLRTPQNHAFVAVTLAQLEREEGREEDAQRWATESRRWFRSGEMEDILDALGLPEA